MLADFLKRLGREVEVLADDRLVARARTALVREERKFKVVQAEGDRFLKTAINVVAPGVALPDDLDDYPDTFYFDGFLDHTVQADRLANAIRADPGIQEQRRDFVPQRAAINGEVVGEDSVSYFYDWLHRPESRLLAILAPAGYGKSALTCELSHRLAEDYLDCDPTSLQPFPYLVPFGEFRRLASFEAMILSSLQRQGVTDYTAPAFTYLVERRRAVLMLDGFDELLEERPEEAQKNLRELIETLGGRGKVVVTARSTFFRTSDDVADFLEYGIAPEQVGVIELLPFDKQQRAQLIARRLPTQRQVATIGQFIEHENVREAMGSPLLLRETIDALTDPDEENRLDRAAGRKDLFAELEHSVYKRERARHGHLFSDETQRLFLQGIAEALLMDNARGFDFELIQVLASEAADEDEAEASDVAQLADHHFLTVDHESEEARFNHQVFREYFQARAVIASCQASEVDQAFALLSQRAIPESVRAFLAELDERKSLPASLLDRYEAGGRANERLISNLGALVVSFRDRGLFERFLSLVPAEAGLSLEVRNLDLSGSDWSGRVLLNVSFQECELSSADFQRSAIGDLTLTSTGVDDALFTGSTIESLVLQGGPRIFGTPDSYAALTRVGADCGLRTAEDRRTLEESRNDQVVQMLRDRLYRFYRPGQTGPKGSRWDSSIKENNFFGGVAPRDRKFTKKKLLPAMRGAGLIRLRRAHNAVIYDLLDDGEDDARVLIEQGEVRGRVEEAVRSLVA